MHRDFTTRRPENHVWSRRTLSGHMIGQKSSGIFIQTVVVRFPRISLAEVVFVFILAREIRSRIGPEGLSENSIDSDLEKKSSRFDAQRFHHETAGKIMCGVVVLF